jgi:hypothetical protein
LQAPLSLIGVTAAIACRVIRDMITTITVATMPTVGAVVIVAPVAVVTVVTVVMVRAVAMEGAAVMMAMAATAGPTIDEPAGVDLGLRNAAAGAGVSAIA